jgi:hypothetical protein
MRNLLSQNILFLLNQEGKKRKEKSLMLSNSQNSRRIIQENPGDLKKKRGKSSKGNVPKNLKKVKK